MRCTQIHQPLSHDHSMVEGTSMFSSESTLKAHSHQMLQMILLTTELIMKQLILLMVELILPMAMLQLTILLIQATRLANSVVLITVSQPLKYYYI